MTIIDSARRSSGLLLAGTVASECRTVLTYSVYTVRRSAPLESSSYHADYRAQMLPYSPVALPNPAGHNLEGLRFPGRFYRSLAGGALMRLILLTIAAACFAFPAIAAEHPGYRVLAQDKGHVVIVSPKGRSSGRCPCKYTSHDLALLPNGNFLLHTGPATVVEMTPEKEVVWKYEAKPKAGYKGRVEVHAFQRLADGNTMIAESGNAPHHRGGQGRQDRQGDAADGREARAATATRGWSASSTTATTSSATRATACVREYDDDGKVVWEYKLDLGGRPRRRATAPRGTAPSVFGALRLPNGNTLIGGGNNNRVLEVTPEGKIVWSIDQKELPGITLAWVTTLQRPAQRQHRHRQLPRRPGQPAAHRGDARQEGRVDLQGLQEPRQRHGRVASAGGRGEGDAVKNPLPLVLKGERAG